MAGEFKLNNSPVTESEFRIVENFLRDLGSTTAVDQAIEDRNISQDEFLRLVDFNHDGKSDERDIFQNPRMSRVLFGPAPSLNFLLETSFGRNSFTWLLKDSQRASQMKKIQPGDWAPSSLLGNYEKSPEGLAILVESNFHLMPFLQESIQVDVWKKVLQRLKDRGIPLEESKIGRFSDFQKYLSENGLKFQERVLSVETALMLVHNSKNLNPADKRPIALLIFNVSDWNGAFGRGGSVPVVDTFYQSGKFHLLYYEVRTEDEFRDIRKNVVRTLGQKIHTLVLAGHGNGSSLALGAGDPARSAGSADSEDLIIDSSDILKGELDDLPSQMQPGGQLLLYACSTGNGSESSENLANRFAGLLPRVRIISSTKQTNLESLAIHSDLSLGVRWFQEDSLYIPNNAQWASKMGLRLFLGDSVSAGNPFVGVLGGWKTQNVRRARIGMNAFAIADFEKNPAGERKARLLEIGLEPVGGFSLSPKTQFEFGVRFGYFERFGVLKSPELEGGRSPEKRRGVVIEMAPRLVYAPFGGTLHLSGGLSLYLNNSRNDSQSPIQMRAEGGMGVEF